LLHGYKIFIINFLKNNVVDSTMRIAVSGTHFIGKSTLIEDFITAHPDYTCEIEPYYKLQDEKRWSYH
jgi:hypothetical protein